MTTEKTVGLITARGGSKSIPRKNLAQVGGKPLIAWTIEAALRSRGLSRVIVSTDDGEIADVCRQWGAEVPFIRPPELARDDSSHISAVLHALDWLDSQESIRPDYMMILQPTSPLRTTEDIDGAVQLANEKRAETVVSVCETHHHPYLTMRLTEGGTLAPYIPDVPRSGSSAARRQTLPTAYFVNGAIYLCSRQVLYDKKTFLPEDAFPYVMPPERSLQIDGPWDLSLIRLILEGKDG